MALLFRLMVNHTSTNLWLNFQLQLRRVLPTSSTHGVVGGFDVSNWYADKSNQMLLTVTDQTTQRDMTSLTELLHRMDKGGGRLSRLLNTLVQKERAMLNRRQCSLPLN